MFLLTTNTVFHSNWAQQRSHWGRIRDFSSNIFTEISKMIQECQITYIIWPALLFWKAFYSANKNSMAIIEPDGMPWIKVWLELTKMISRKCSMENQEHVALNALYSILFFISNFIFISILIFFSHFFPNFYFHSQRHECNATDA